MYNAVLVLGTQQSDSVIYNMYLFFFRLFPFLGYFKVKWKLIDILKQVCKHISKFGSIINENIKIIECVI